MEPLVALDDRLIVYHCNMIPLSTAHSEEVNREFDSGERTDLTVCRNVRETGNLFSHLVDRGADEKLKQTAVDQKRLALYGIIQ